MLKSLYEAIKTRIDTLDFSALWPGFHPFPFALYDGQRAFMGGEVFAQPPEFLGNTAIRWRGALTAIWGLSGEDADADVLAADIVHEMFHAFQMEQGEGRFPDDLAAFAYPENEENYGEKHTENCLLAQAYACEDRAGKRRLLAQVIALRTAREARIGDAVLCELLPETVEGLAEFVGSRALSALSPQHYARRMCRSILEITQLNARFLDIRRQAYFTGLILASAAADAGIPVFHELCGETRPMSKRIAGALQAEKVCAPRVEASAGIGALLADRRVRREETIARVLQSGTRRTGRYAICGYDPMNMWKQGTWLYGRHFWMLEDEDTGERIMLSGESLLMHAQGRRVTGYVSAE